MQRVLVAVLLCVFGLVPRGSIGTSLCVSHPDTRVLRVNVEEFGMCLLLPGRACFEVKGLVPGISYEAVVSHSLASTPARISLSFDVDGAGTRAEMRGVEEDGESEARPPLRLRQLEVARRLQERWPLWMGQGLPSLRFTPEPEPEPPSSNARRQRVAGGRRRLDTDKLVFTHEGGRHGQGNRRFLCVDAERHVPARDAIAGERPLIYSIRVEKLDLGFAPQIVSRLILFAAALAALAWALRSTYRAVNGPSGPQLWRWLAN